MIVFRICKDKYATDLSGRGAEKAGGRWNTKGYPVIYTSSSRALAALEMSVHLPLGLLPENYKLISIQIPDDLEASSIVATDLPENWKDYPIPRSAQLIGTAWLKSGATLLLKVPSVIVEQEFNYLINPLHQEFHRISISDISDFKFDLRLFS